MKKKTFNTAIYIRLSREDGDRQESYSISNQKKLLTDYVLNHDDLNLFDIYVDDGYTGTNFVRPDFQQMMSDIETSKVNCVVVKDLSRFGRDYIDTGRYLERLFPDLGIRFISITDNIDSMKQAYDMLLPIKNIFNEQYARDISNKIQTTVKSKQKSGEFIGAFTSYGYKKSPANKNKLIIDTYAANVVRRIFSLFIQGYGKQTIAKILNEEGILCPTEYKQANGENYKNSNRLKSTTYWSYSTINDILHREMYIGNMVQGTKHQRMRSKQKSIPKEDWIVIANTHEPIIEKEVWEKAQTLLKIRTRKLDLETNKNIFAGLIRCGDCGRAMSKSMWRLADGSRVFTLYCGTYKRYGKKYCSPHTLPMHILDAIVLNDLKTIIQNVDNLNELAKADELTNNKTKKFADTELHKINLELERLKNLKRSIYEDYKEELISKEEFLSYREDYIKREQLYKKHLEMLESTQNENMTENILNSPWLKRLLEMKDIESLDRNIVVEMISEIKVYEDHRIKIIYNFSDELEYLFTKIYTTNGPKSAV